MPLTEIIDPLVIADNVIEAVDDNVWSRQEWEDALTARHLADVNSDSPLAKAIRPIITIWAMAVNTVIWMGLLFTENTLDSTVVLTAGGVLSSAIGFYFYNRRVEKITARKVAASIQIEKLRARSEVREARKANRQARRLERQQQKEGEN
jgi:hypothetical protein